MLVKNRPRFLPAVPHRWLALAIGCAATAASTFGGAVFAAPSPDSQTLSARQESVLVPELIREAQSYFPKPGRLTYYPEVMEVWKVQYRSGDHKGAAKSLNDARRYVVEAPNSPSNKDSMLRYIAETQARYGDVKGARRTVDAVVRPLDKVLGLGTIAEIVAKAGDRKLSRRLFSDAQKIALANVNPVHRGNSLSYLAGAVTRAGDLTMAREFAVMIPDDRSKSQALKNIAYLQTEAGDLSGAKETTDRLPGANSRGVLLKRTAVAKTGTGEFDVARQVASAIEGTDEKAYTLTYIAEKQAEAGDFAGAWRTAERIWEGDKSNAYGRRNALLSIIRVHARIGNVADAKKAAQSVSDAWACGSVLASIAVIQAKSGDGGGAQRTFADAKEATDAIPEAFPKSAVLSAIGRAQIQAGLPGGARENLLSACRFAATIVADTMEEVRNKASVLREIAMAQVRMGDWDAARESAAAIGGTRARRIEPSFANEEPIGDIYEYERVRGETFESIADEQVAAGDFAGATRTADAILNPIHKAGTLCRIAQAQTKAGDTSGAKITLDRAKQTTE
ncbi:MAG: hypothetical protein H7145_01100, partial [Akkermansiaceae bacterium]|nr:hypothetical protein [Armatimonadota bacterium]